MNRCALECSRVSYPVWIAIGPLRFHPHMVFELLAFAVGIVVYQSIREKQGDHLTVAQRWSLFAALAVGAVTEEPEGGSLQPTSTPVLAGAFGELSR